MIIISSSNLVEVLRTEAYTALSSKKNQLYWAFRFLNFYSEKLLTNQSNIFVSNIKVHAFILKN